LLFLCSLAFSIFPCCSPVLLRLSTHCARFLPCLVFCISYRRQITR
jgi:hypothetical protein